MLMVGTGGLLLFCFSILMMIGNQAFKDYIPKSNGRILLDIVIMLTQITFIGLNIYLFQVNMGSWYGWLIGVIVGWILMTLWVPKRWDTESKYNI
ncbi:hypothetical protein D3C76_698590 [compost metagenome]